MIKSMTACAESSSVEDLINVDVEIRSYNSRHLDVALYMPGAYPGFEDGIKKLVNKKITRGRVEIRVAIEDQSEESPGFEVDEKRAAAYFKALSFLKESLSIKSEITLEQLLADRDIIKPQKKRSDSELVWKALSSAVAAAVDDLDKMRKKEGDNLVFDFNERILFIENKLKIIQEYADTIPGIYKQRLMERISRLTQGVEEIDSARLAQEAAILADKSDISEEIIRAHSHIKQFRQIMASDEPGGRKLNFLIQEFNREFNTMGSKAGKPELSHVVVELKSELEKIREQIQNIE
ncbi:MAG: YicC/YloC family endoribonuclease [Thermodesulfobacteriota bacterium]|nr:YicC/YloC family endoribonuclease [Thermodesulfobacteriota bacterium]